jgi:eukaryotic-like serine/threonine-protein kinase
VQGNAATLTANDPAWGWVETLRYQHAMRDGDLGRATRAVDKAIAAYAHAGDLRNVCVQRMNHGVCLTQLGQFEMAAETLRLALSQTERLGASYTAARARQHLGHVLVLLGRNDEAATMLTAARAAFTQHGDQRAEAGTCAYLAEARAARPVEAEALLRAAVTLVEQVPPMRAALHAQLARLLVARGAVEEALALTRPAHELIESGGPVEEREALVRLAHVEALTAAGLQEEASAVAWVALERLKTRAARLGDPSWADSFLQRVPANAETVSLASLLAAADSN